MNKSFLIKICAVIIVLFIGLIGFIFSRKSEFQVLNPAKTPEKILDEKSEIIGYKNWVKVNDKPELMLPKVAQLCDDVRKEIIDAKFKNPHNNKYINVYVNSIGKDEMMTKTNPDFPIGTVVVKEKLSLPDSQMPELLTVMVKREAGFNPDVGDWEFITLNGQATEVTAKGKLENCQACHLSYKYNDFITRTYLPEEIRKNLK